MSVTQLGIEPLYDHVIVAREEGEEQTSGGIVIPDTAKEKPSRGKVLAAGKGKMLDNGQVSVLVVKVGDRVIFGKYAGTEFEYQSKKYLILRESDILAKIA